MFSWIIEHKARILSINDGVFTVQNTFTESLDEGQSIAHDGACMTLTNISPESYSFFAMQETLRVTNFGTKQVGDFFNVERSLQLSDRLDGHLVSGHIDTVGSVIELTKKEDGSLVLYIQCDTLEQKYIIQKWSIAVNGVSLTVVEVSGNTFSVSLIPLTQSWTNLGALQLRDVLNIEYDMMAKYVAKIVSPLLTS